MLDQVIELDRGISLAINNWNSVWADGVMSFFSNMYVWIPLYVLMVVWILGLYKRKGLWILLGVIVLIAVADWTSVHWFKNVFCRLRPCHEPLLEGLLNLPVGCGGRYGFISSHAVNHFALAAYLTPWFVSKRKSNITVGIPADHNKTSFESLCHKGLGFFSYGGLYIWAVIIGYSRVYVAAHYVGDVICGTIWGILLGLGCYLITKKAISYLPSSAVESPSK